MEEVCNISSYAVVVFLIWSYHRFIRVEILQYPAGSFKSYSRFLKPRGYLSNAIGPKTDDSSRIPIDFLR